MDNDKHEDERPTETNAVPTRRPTVPLHDPWNRFDFEPTDGGDF